MKKHLSLLIIIIVLIMGCNNRTGSAQAQDPAAVASGIKKMKPGSFPTIKGGYTLTAKINGKEWSASSMMSPQNSGRIVGDNNGESISLPYYDQRNFLSDKKTKLGDNHQAVDMMLNDDVKIWSAKTGDMEITKVGDNWIEGTFHFTAKGFETDKTMEVTDGFFRIPLYK